MDTPHRFKIATTTTHDGARSVGLPWFDTLALDDGGETAWVNVPAEDCPCNFADTEAWHAYLTGKYGPPQKVAAWGRAPRSTLPGLTYGPDIHDDAPRYRDGSAHPLAMLEDPVEDASPGARASQGRAALAEAKRAAAALLRGEQG